MAPTKGYLRRRAQYNVAHTKLLFATVSSYDPTHKETIVRWVKSSMAQAGVNTFFSFHSCRLSVSSKGDSMGEHLNNILKTGCWSQQSIFRKFYSKELEYMNKDSRVAETIANIFEN